MPDPSIGDVVKLKSGGPLMTVTAVTTARRLGPSDAPKDHVQCQWFDADHNSRMLRLPLSALEPD